MAKLKHEARGIDAEIMRHVKDHMAEDIHELLLDMPDLGELSWSTVTASGSPSMAYELRTDSRVIATVYDKRAAQVLSASVGWVIEALISIEKEKLSAPDNKDNSDDG